MAALIEINTPAVEDNHPVVFHPVVFHQVEAEGKLFSNWLAYWVILFEVHTRSS